MLPVDLEPETGIKNVVCDLHFLLAWLLVGRILCVTRIFQHPGWLRWSRDAGSRENGDAKKTRQTCHLWRQNYWKNSGNSWQMYTHISIYKHTIASIDTENTNSGQNPLTNKKKKAYKFIVLEPSSNMPSRRNTKPEWRNDSQWINELSFERKKINQGPELLPCT